MPATRLCRSSSLPLHTCTALGSQSSTISRTHADSAAFSSERFSAMTPRSNLGPVHAECQGARVRIRGRPLGTRAATTDTPIRGRNECATLRALPTSAPTPRVSLRTCVPLDDLRVRADVAAHGLELGERRKSVGGHVIEDALFEPIRQDE